MKAEWSLIREIVCFHSAGTFMIGGLPVRASSNFTITVLDRDGRIVERSTGDAPRSIVQSQDVPMGEIVTLSSSM